MSIPILHVVIAAFIRATEFYVFHVDERIENFIALRAAALSHSYICCTREQTTCVQQ